MIAASPARGQNGAILEGAFGLFEHQVGTVRLHHTDRASLVTRATREVLRARGSAVHPAPRADYDGKRRCLVARVAEWQGAVSIATVPVLPADGPGNDPMPIKTPFGPAS